LKLIQAFRKVFDRRYANTFVTVHAANVLHSHCFTVGT